MTCRDSSSYAGAGHSIDKRRGWAFRDAYAERCATFLAVQQCARHMLRLERSLIVSEKRRACAGTNVLVGKCQATVVIEVRNEDGELCDFFFPFCFLFPLRDWESWLDVQSVARFFVLYVTRSLEEILRTDILHDNIRIVFVTNSLKHCWNILYFVIFDVIFFTLENCKSMYFKISKFIMNKNDKK